ncbi:MAG: alpha-L-fucosidase [Edaphobacter sp.]|uniref:alpha-L-fucosidase n=1 Tax=Edaphobacter sp. TaxID=1934404 RepID=UPI0023A4C6CC|nr:alpha-L-fucosidase [Edaphobacter sp.]MDE1175267.1 alpha-L-fucosidase [Edaphobacter sp.]
MFMRRLCSSLLALALSPAFCAPSQAQSFPDIKPNPAQLHWQDLEIGVIIHFSTNTFLNREWGDGTASPSTFNPTHVDTDQWMQAARAGGAKYAVLVAKHHDGFALFPSSNTDYSVKASPWLNGKGDLVRLASDSAHQAGLGFGVYLSPWDRHDKRYPDPAAYDKYYLAQLTELSTHYGPLAEFWLDGAGSAGRTYDFNKIIEELRTYQPNTVVFADTALFKDADARWVGSEDGTVPYENWNVIDRAGYLRWRPVEADTPLRKLHWFWHPNDEASLLSLNELLDIYNKTVGRGAQLMLGLAPDNTGLLPESDANRLREFGEAVQRLYGPASNLAVKTPHTLSEPAARSAVDNDPSTFWSAPARHATLELSFAKPITFDRALTMEWLNEGQHVQEYSIEVWQNGAWKTIAHAQAIGHKKIDIFPAVTAQRVRLNLLSTVGSAGIREFQIFNGSVTAR